MSNYPPTPPKKKPVWRWVALGCGIAVVGLIAFATVVFVGITAAMRSSAAYQDAMERVRTDPRVAAALGTPIEPGWLITGSVNTENDSGNANVSFKVHGPKGKATVYVVGTKERGRWTYSSMVLTPESGPEIDLLSEESPGTAPPAS